MKETASPLYPQFSKDLIRACEAAWLLLAHVTDAHFSLPSIPPE